jgi:hypothetical protein
MRLLEASASPEELTCRWNTTKSHVARTRAGELEACRLGISERLHDLAQHHEGAG